MCIPIHAAVLQRDEDDASQAVERGPSVPPVATPSPDAQHAGGGPSRRELVSLRSASPSCA